MLSIPITIDTHQAGHLNFQSEPMHKFKPLALGTICVTEKSSSERLEVERFIESIYAQSYRAVIARHYPTLISVRNQSGTLLTAVGFRPAAMSSLYLEQYLDVPVEAALSHVFSRVIPRENTVEIGNLASAGNGAAVFAFVALMAYLQHLGMTHLALTGTKLLRGYFRKLGLDPRDMGAADPQRLPDGGKSWGSYYDTDPRLIGGDVKASYNQLCQLMLAEQVCKSGEYQAQLHPQPWKVVPHA